MELLFLGVVLNNPYVMDETTFSERDICNKFVKPAIEKAGWNKTLHHRIWAATLRKTYQIKT